jgi:hypothetical protein
MENAFTQTMTYKSRMRGFFFALLKYTFCEAIVNLYKFVINVCFVQNCDKNIIKTKWCIKLTDDKTGSNKNNNNQIYIWQMFCLSHWFQTTTIDLQHIFTFQLSYILKNEFLTSFA